MPTPPYVLLDSIHTPSVGGTPPASWGIGIRNNFQALARPPGCVVRNSTPLSVASSTSTLTDMRWDAGDERDTDGYHDIIPNPELIGIPSGLGGWYDIGWYVNWSANTAGRRLGVITVNSVARAGITTLPSTTGGTGQYGADHLLLNAGDIVTLALTQNSGSTLNVNPARLWMRLVAWA